MKKKLLSIAIAAVFALSAASVSAAPWNAAENGNDPSGKFVAYYPTGPHSIAGMDGQFEGADLVMMRGNSGQIQQWFEGTINGEYAAIHSVWNLAGKDGTCPEGWVKIENAYPQWGYYLVPGATYCVHNNYYQGTK